MYNGARSDGQPIDKSGEANVRKIAVVNRKGGTAKTTTAVSLSAALAQLGYGVLLVDADSQGHCAVSLGVEPEAGLAELIDGSVDPEKALTKARDNLWLLGGSKALGGITREISRKDFRAELVLTEALRPYEDRFDFAIIDSGPGYTPLSVNILFYAEEAVVPVAVEALAAHGLVSFLEELEAIRKHSSLSLRFIVPTFVDGRVKKSEEILKQLGKHFAGQLGHPIRYSVKLSEAASWGKTIFEYAARDRGAVDYLALTKEVLRG